VNVVIDIVSPPEEWRSLGDGFRVDARVTLLEDAGALEVPSSALFRESEHWAVYVVESGRARRRAVDLGPRGERTAVVAGGLSEGDQVIIYPSDAVYDGARVKERSSDGSTR
jgi:HlyD family secretion protein